MILSATLSGVAARPVKIVVTREETGLPALDIKGLKEAAMRETRVRVQAALSDTDWQPRARTTVVCDAGGASIDGSALDLPIALAIASGGSGDVGAVGELSLAGDVRPVRGALASVEALRGVVDVVVVARENAAEASLVDGIRVVVAGTLKDALAFLRGDRSRVESVTRNSASRSSAYPDMADIKGQPQLRRALEVAAAGGHNLLLVGSAGTGKTMAARRLTGILPPLSEDEALDVTRVHSCAGLNIGGGLMTARPFRAPHHSTTPPGLVGGGATLPRPGEVSLAHHGVLFLDELPEFSRPTLEVLREPLATGEVVLSRASGTLRFPSRCIVVGSMSPCPCGHFGSPRCRCSQKDCARYTARVPDALMRHFDLRVTVLPIDLTAIDGAAPAENSERIAARVLSARALMNATTPLPFDDDSRRELAAVTERSADPKAAHERLLNVARTVAALGGETRVRQRHVGEAITLAL